MRQLLAWIVFRVGDVIYIVFDRWLPWGMTGPIYKAYSGAMTLSLEIQGDGPGPWLPASPELEAVNGRLA